MNEQIPELVGQQADVKFQPITEQQFRQGLDLREFGTTPVAHMAAAFMGAVLDLASEGMPISAYLKPETKEIAIGEPYTSGHLIVLTKRFRLAAHETTRSGDYYDKGRAHIVRITLVQDEEKDVGEYLPQTWWHIDGEILTNAHIRPDFKKRKGVRFDLLKKTFPDLMREVVNIDRELIGGLYHAGAGKVIGTPVIEKATPSKPRPFCGLYVGFRPSALFCK